MSRLFSRWVNVRESYFFFIFPQLAVHFSKRLSNESLPQKGKIFGKTDPMSRFLRHLKYFKIGKKMFLFFKYAHLKFSYGNTMKYLSLSYRSSQWILTFFTLSLLLLLVRWDCNVLAKLRLVYFAEGKPTSQHPVFLLNSWSFKTFMSPQFATTTSVG